MEPENNAGTYPDASTTKDWIDRLREARGQKSLVEIDLQEALFFTRPRMARQVTSTTPVTSKTAQQEDDDELATSIGSEVAEDFATELISAFFPQNTNWAESSADAVALAGAPKDEQEAFKKQIVEYDNLVFSAIRSSNFSAELGVALDPDAAIGTVGMWIDAPGGGRPYRCEHVPIRELEFSLDPDGNPGDRFRVRHVRSSKLKAVIGNIALPEKVKKKLKPGSNSVIEVVWCFGRDWSRPHDDVYDHVLLVDKCAVHQSKLVGEGSLPLSIWRFSPDKVHSWGNGPAIKSLPDFRVLDAITAATQDRCDVAISPPMSFPDDGILDFPEGIQAGKGYRHRLGSGKDIANLYFEGEVDLGFYTASDLETKIRRKFFADFPEQKGDTPPTATQWIDLMVRAQRRIGTPGLKFWSEGPYQVFRRFEYLLNADGKVKKPTINGQAISLTPNNPATQAQDNQKLQLASQLLSIIKSYFPETSQAAIDEHRTIEKMKLLMKDEVIVLRDPEDVERLVNAILSQVTNAGGAGAPTPAQ